MKNRKGYIYKIENTENGRVYVGATSRSVGYRKAEHKYNAFKRGLDYQIYRDMLNDGWGKFEWDILEVVDIDHLHKREAYWISRLGANKGYNYNNVNGERHHKAKLTERDVFKIRRLLADGEMTQREIAKRFGVAQVTISNIKLGNIWKHLGNEEEFAREYARQLQEFWGESWKLISDN